jgi:hypothetical protein
MKHQVAIDEPENYLGPSDLVCCQMFVGSWKGAYVYLLQVAGKPTSNPLHVLADTELDMEPFLVQMLHSFSGDNNK